MKKFNLKCMMAGLLCMSVASTKAQFHFSISPGMQLNGALFGYKLKKCVPYIGFQMMGGSVNFTETGKKHDPNTGDVIDYKDLYKASGAVYIPSLGCKYFFIETNKLKAYANLSVSKFLLSAKVEDSNDPAATVDLKKALDNTRIYGAQLGFGTEYFFDGNFSIGGEFGFRMIHVNFKEERTETISDPNTGNLISYSRVSTSKINFNPTYTKLSLNFYFGQ